MLKHDSSDLGKSNVLRDLWIWKETRQAWAMFSKLKALVSLEKFRDIFCSIVQKMTTRNLRFQEWYHM